jgi:hypothetical protein
MRSDFANKYYHGGVVSENIHQNDRRNQLRDGDFGREYENRYKGHDGRNRLDYNTYQNRNNMDPYKSSYLSPGEFRSKRGYGVEESMRGGYGYDADRNGNDRNLTERNEGGYGSKRTGGYSGSGFGGSNYSAHGSYGGGNQYGSMSGGGGNMGLYSSKSGYGNPGISTDRSQPRTRSRYGDTSDYFGNSNLNKDNPNYAPDRGGYTNYDPNNRWNS